MKIVQIVNFFLPDNIGGTEVYVNNLSKELLNEQIEVIVLRPDYWGRENYMYEDTSVVYYKEEAIKDFRQLKGFLPPSGLSSFVEKLQMIKPDIIHFHEITGSNGITHFHIEAAKKTGAKIVMTFHLSHYTCKTGNLYFKQREPCDGVINITKCSFCDLHNRGVDHLSPIIVPASLLFRLMNLNTNKYNTRLGNALGVTMHIEKKRKDLLNFENNCDRIVVITKWYKEILRKNNFPIEKMKYIPQGHLFSNSTEDTIAIPKSIGVLKLLFVGRITRFKGLHLLLEAMSQIPKEKIHLDIFGQDGDEAYMTLCKEKIKDLGNVFFKGSIESSEVVNKMKEYDMLCLCSTFSEMSPLVIQEAFAAGIPVLASNVYGNSEQIIDNKNGILFEYNDVKSLLSKLNRLIMEPELKYDLAKNIDPPLNFKQVGREYVKLYQELLNR